ncbi:MAG: co-chaperone GroES [Candidatus Dojkabacteria bacterium]|jgi:chaperonin GroES
MNIKPLGDRVLVKPVQEEEQVRGGIIIPDTAKEKPMQGEIVAVGPGKVTEEGKTLPMHVQKGQIVLYGKYAGTDVKIDGEEYLIMSQGDIFGIIEK